MSVGDTTPRTQTPLTELEAESCELHVRPDSELPLPVSRLYNNNLVVEHQWVEEDTKADASSSEVTHRPAHLQT